MTKNELARAKNFAYPYPRLLMEGKLNITGEKNSGVKSSNVYFRPTEEFIFIRTSKNVHRSVWQRYEFVDPNHSIHKKAKVIEEGHVRLGVINGVAKLSDVRGFTSKEEYDLFCAFNNLDPKDRASKQYFDGRKRLEPGEPNLVWPLDLGLFFTDVRPFRNPVVHEIKPGAVNIVKVPRTQALDWSLREVGLNWADMLPSK